MTEQQALDLFGRHGRVVGYSSAPTASGVNLTGGGSGGTDGGDVGGGSGGQWTALVRYSTAVEAIEGARPALVRACVSFPLWSAASPFGSVLALRGALLVHSPFEHHGCRAAAQHLRRTT